MLIVLRGALGAAACLTLPGAAFAHATLATTQAAPGAYRGVVQINHGCGGAPTIGVTVTIPDGVIAVRPMPKPGWRLEIRNGAYAKPYPLYGKDVTEGARTLIWSGGTLPDDQYDEFTFVARIAEGAPGSTVYFPIEQACEGRVANWAEIPAPGQDASALKQPAPGVRMLAAATSTTVVKAGDLTIETPWMRATPGGAKVAGGYLRVTNTGTAPDRLVGASMPLAQRGEVHEMSMEGGIMRMRPVEGGLAIKPGETVELKPGGFHLMFMDLAGAVKAGEAVKGTLTFERAGTVPVEFAVGGIGAQGPATGGHQH